jgi:multidrug efflux system membrane fusion protein
MKEGGWVYTGTKPSARLVRILVTLSALGLALAGCGRNSARPAAGPAPAGKGGVAVRVAKAERRAVPLEIRAIGNVEAFASVSVRARVAGQLKKVLLTDGQDVKAGDLLFQIDAEPFEEQVRLAEANVARDRALEQQAAAASQRDEALARNARSQAGRYAELQRQGIISRDTADQFRTSAEAAEASLAANRASISSAHASLAAGQARLAEARLQLGYTRVVAPISGRAGFVGIKEGNLVKDSDALVVLLQVEPVLVAFSVPEQSLAAIRRRMAGGGLAVEAAAEGPGAATAIGRLSFLDNTVDASTGMIRLKATFLNRDRALWPGQFVTARLRLETERGALTVATRAVQTGPQGSFAWVARPDGTAEPRPLKVSRTHQDLTVIAAGLEEGETVVTEGQLRLTKGARLDVLGPVAGAQ